MRNFLLILALAAALWWAYDQGWFAALSPPPPPPPKPGPPPSLTVGDLKSLASQAGLTASGVGANPSPETAEVLIEQAGAMAQRPGTVLHRAWLRNAIHYLERVRINPNANYTSEQRRLVADLQDIQRVHE